MLPLVIVNPASASGATGRNWARIASDFAGHFGAFDVRFTEQANDANLFACEEALQGRRFIIACGGDGTINEVANGIVTSGKDVELGVLPSGTGSDFRRTLQMPNRVADAARLLCDGATKRIDVGRVEFTNEVGEKEVRHFVSVASAGMGSRVVERLKKNSSERLPAINAKLLGGKVGFAVAAAQETVTFAQPEVVVTLDDEASTQRELQFQIVNLCVCNGRYFGGGMKIAPRAKLNDGLFDVIVIGAMNTPKILLNAYRIYAGAHLGMNEVLHTRATRISLRAADSRIEIKLEIDGEVSGRLPATFEILPRGLAIRTTESAKSKT